MLKRLWIDLSNPSHPLFFKPIYDDLSRENCEINISIRDRWETASLAEINGLRGLVIGKEYPDPFRKTMSYLSRTAKLAFRVGKFDFGLSFENPTCVAVSKLRHKKAILFLDNDLKTITKTSFIQNMESKVKYLADHIIIPEVCEDNFGKMVKKSRLITYKGYKEDIYIAGHIPNKESIKDIPFKDYIVIRPESLTSFYVHGKTSMVGKLIAKFTSNGQKIVLLPRDPSSYRNHDKDSVFIPESAINGLDLIHYSKAVLTGSGTMAREAAIMGKKAVSFFPNETLLSVDRDLVDRGRMIHSRDVDEIFEYVINDKITREHRDSVKVKDEVISIVKNIIGV